MLQLLFTLPVGALVLGRITISIAPYREIVKQCGRLMTICCQMSVPFQKAHTKPENIQKQYYPKKSCTFPPEQHEFTQRSLAPLTPINGRPFFRHIGLVAEVRSSYPPYPPGRLQVVAPNGLTRREKHRAERTTSECTVVLNLAVCQYVQSTIQPLVIRRRSKRQTIA